MATAFTPHPCSTSEIHVCEGDACGGATGDRYAGTCDPDGCDFNSYRQGNTSFYGPGKTVDTTKVITVVTQFITSGNSSSGSLTEIRRLYKQGSTVVQNSMSTQPSGYNSISTAYCDAQKTLFGDTNSFESKGGMSAIGGALGRGMVLVLSIWDDHAVNMLWLDSTYPTTGDPSTPGIKRGNCSTSSGAPTDVETSAASAVVIYSNIRVGDIGSTYNGTATTTTSSGGGTTTSSSSGGSGGCSVSKWGQCGGINYSGCTVCASGSTCQVGNPYYSQCL